MYMFGEDEINIWVFFSWLVHVYFFQHVAWLVKYDDYREKTTVLYSLNQLYFINSVTATS